MELKIEFVAIKMLPQSLSEGDYKIVSLPAPNGHEEIIQYFKIPKLQILKKGFITSTGEFVGRKKAWKIACEANQILPTPAKNPGKLHTSDIDWSK